ncbi:MAG: ribulokinase [Chitinivibrionales bacterium]|nr:ribulokinase [Chitinivibrionales bacterium]
MSKNYVLGIDYGTDSVRTVLINASDGSEAASSVCPYSRWSEGRYCTPSQNQFRQHPLDYLEGLEKTVKETLGNAPADAAGNVRGLTIDTTGSTPVAVNKEGTPLSLTPEFKDDPDAMFILWKDHTAVKEADEINACAKSWGGVDYTMYEGGVYSSEWFFAKMLHVLRINDKVRDAAYSWVEHCDWLPALLSGNTDPLSLRRSRCAAGHKAMWHRSWNGLPSEDFLTQLDPLLQGVRDRLYTETFTCDQKAGALCDEWAQKLGLQPGIAVGVGAFDAHLGAVGGEIAPHVLLKVMGTSTCDMLIAPMEETGDKLIKGICGQVDGSIIPGMLGMEAGQSAFGDIYAWFREVLMWPVLNVVARSSSLDNGAGEKLVAETTDALIPLITEAAEKISVEESSIIALDWMNGRRTPDANQMLKGAVAGLNLGSTAPAIFRALVEATAFGAKKIIERFVDEGVTIKEVIALGGVAKKSPFVMQTVADVINMSIKVAQSDQACALGSAMCAATAAGLYPTIQQAQKAMGNGFETTYHPRPDKAKIYQDLYRKYCTLGEIVEKKNI